MIEEMRERARADLLIRLEAGSADPVLWEHAERVCRCALAVADLPGVVTDSIDRDALQAAAWYHNAGWQVQYMSGQVPATEILLRPTSDLSRELAADWVRERLEGVVSPKALELASRAIRECNNRRTSIVEARILADANNLEDIGPQALGLLVRKQISDGKTLADWLESWKRQEEYHYWQARLKDGFHFPQVRRIAEERCDLMRRFVADLDRTLTLSDVNHSHSGTDAHRMNAS